MTDDRFSFDGLNSIEARLLRRAEDIGYIVIVDRTVRDADETLGRFDFTDSEAMLHLTESLPPEPGDDDPSEVPSPSGFDLALHPRGQPIPMRIIAEVACRWIRGMAERNTVGERYRRFRIKVWNPKGANLIDSGQFVCRNHALDEDLPDEVEVAQLRIPDPTFDVAANAGAAKGIRALGDYYAQWGQIVLGSVGQMQGVNNAMLNRMHRQLQESRDQVDQLVASVLEHRFLKASAEDERASEARAGDARHELAKEALQQIGDAAKTFLAAKGVTPEMADLLALIGQSPDLLGALNDAEVRALMKDPNNLKALGMMLQQTAAQARAVRDAAANAAETPAKDAESKAA